MVKTYTRGNVTYGAAGRRWTFKTENYQYSTPVMPLGRETADRVAGVISGAVKRSGTMDDLGRGQLYKVFHDAQIKARNLVER